MRSIFYLISFLFPVLLHAQIDVQGVYLLDDFTVSVASTKQGNLIRASFNYDCVKQEMQFEENGEVFKLESINNIDTLYLGNHKMVPYNNRFVDMVYDNPHYTLFVDYKRKIINAGKKGAMGSTTQGTVESIDFSKSGIAYNRMQMVDNAVYNTKDSSGYILIINRKAKRFDDDKSLKKIFSGKKGEIDTYLKEHKVSFRDKEAVISLIDFILK